MEFAFALCVFVGSSSWETANLMDRVATYTSFRECWPTSKKLNDDAILAERKVRYTCIKVPKQ